MDDLKAAAYAMIGINEQGKSLFDAFERMKRDKNFTTVIEFLKTPKGHVVLAADVNWDDTNTLEKQPTFLWPVGSDGFWMAEYLAQKWNITDKPRVLSAEEGLEFALETLAIAAGILRELIRLYLGKSNGEKSE